jgi:hypothetical protein
MCSFHITNAFTNMPITQLSETIKQILNKSHEQPNRNLEILNMVHTVLDQKICSHLTMNSTNKKQDLQLEPRPQQY